MVFKAFEYWDVAIDGVQIFLCLLILVFLIRNQSKHKQSVFMKAKRGAENEPGQSFAVQVFTENVKQQADQAFVNIFETIAFERRRLERALQFDHLSDEAFRISDFQMRSNESNSQEFSMTSKDKAKSGGRHEQIQKLATKGLSAKQISEELKTPQGEVELILSLQNK